MVKNGRGTHERSSLMRTSTPSEWILFSVARDPPSLFAILAVTPQRLNFAEQAVSFIHDAGGKEQRVLVTGAVAVAELQRPQAVDGDRPIPHIFQLPVEF